MFSGPTRSQRSFRAQTTNSCGHRVAGVPRDHVCGVGESHVRDQRCIRLVLLLWCRCLPSMLMRVFGRLQRIRERTGTHHVPLTCWQLRPHATLPPSPHHLQQSQQQQHHPHVRIARLRRHDSRFKHNANSLKHLEGLTAERHAEARQTGRQVVGLRRACMRSQKFQIKLTMQVRRMMIEFCCGDEIDWW